MDDAKLNALLAAEVPSDDPHFAIAVMARIEQRRFRRELAKTAGLAALAVLLLALLAPSLEAAWSESFAPFANNTVIAMLLLAITIAVPQFFPSRSD